jgi:hypothetical protein
MLSDSIFWDINLPNPTTWFYFSWLLAVALFFKFSRLLSMRNLDVLTLYLLLPGFLLLLESGRRLDLLVLAAVPPPGPGVVERERQYALQLRFYGYLWLMVSSAYFLVRCLLDLALVRRPALDANLNLSGLAWLAGALYVSLVAVAVRQPVDPGGTKDTSTMGAVGDTAQKAIQPYAPIAAERVLALLCHLSVATALVLIGWRHFESVHAGMAAATCYLLLPYTFLLLPDSPLRFCRWHLIWPMALVAWAVFTYRRPLLAGAFLGVATGTAFFLLALLPAWVSFYRGRGAVRFVLSFVLSAGLGLGVLGGVLWVNNGELPSSLQSDWTKSVWQPWKSPAAGTPGFWQDMDSKSVARAPAAYRVPVFIASLALVLTSAVWPSPKNLAHVLALSAACLLSIQFWYADRGGVYVLWYLPLLLLLVFRPNLTHAVPPAPPADDWPARLGNWVGRHAARWAGVGYRLSVKARGPRPPASLPTDN